MKFPPIAFDAVDFASIPPTVEGGATGESVFRASERSDLRMRVVEYGAGYVADHWRRPRARVLRLARDD